MLNVDILWSGGLMCESFSHGACVYAAAEWQSAGQWNSASAS